MTAADRGLRDQLAEALERFRSPAAARVIADALLPVVAR